MAHPSQYRRAEVLASSRLGYLAFGNNPAVGATYEQLWAQGGAYNFTMGSGALKLASSDADDAAGDTGARTVQVHGYVAGVYAEEAVTMNGQTPVELTTAFDRILFAHVVTAGSSGANEGDIYCFTGTATAGVPDTATEVYFKMAALGGRTHVAIAQVPAGMVGHVLSFWASQAEAANPCEVQLCLRVGGVHRTVLTAIVFETVFVPPPFEFPIAVPAGADVYIRAKNLGAGAAEVAGAFEIAYGTP